MRLTALTPKAVLFDMDGVLYDSMPCHAQAWLETAIARGLQATAEDFYLFEGRTSKSTIDELFLRTFRRNASKEEMLSINEEKTARFNALNSDQVMPGAVEVVRLVKASGLQTLIVTGSGQHSLIDRLDRHFPGCFEREKMVTAFDVVLGKPHPEPYLKGLQKAGVSACEALVVENAPMGVQAAVSAGIFTIAVNTGPLPDSILLDAGADLLYPDMLSLAADWSNITANLLKSVD
ncbi:Phosphorylated carbohydrates phosphatase [Bacteroidales bacterium Barb6XT]|nr:Phosphorylated carbohydrates phosphatase [Bacteroidales bacterium Barb6XT]